MEITQEMREKAKTIALKVLEQFQSDGLSEKEVKLIAFWIKSLADDIIEANQFKNSFSLPKT